MKQQTSVTTLITIINHITPLKVEQQQISRLVGMGNVEHDNEGGGSAHLPHAPVLG
jgi:hypothetical protein